MKLKVGDPRPTSGESTDGSEIKLSDFAQEAGDVLLSHGRHARLHQAGVLLRDHNAEIKARRARRFWVCRPRTRRHTRSSLPSIS
jgi:hypothetical protein